jgi:hypothetical protein
MTMVDRKDEKQSEKQGQTGRGLPPKETRWKKGTSGNPRGRPKAPDCLTSLLRKEVVKLCPADKQNRTWAELVMLATLQLAMKGNQTALKEVWERLDGKIPQTSKMHLGGPNGRQLMIKVVYEDADNNPS